LVIIFIRGKILYELKGGFQVDMDILFKNYLSTENTDYAILINGEWGVGKTYYYENTLKAIIKECGKEPVKISLYGKDKVDAIINEITYEIIKNSIGNIAKERIGEEKLEKLNTIDKNLKKWPASLLNALMNKGFGKVTDLLKDKANVDNFFDIYDYYPNIVLVFDDFERCKVNIVELLGFINSFLEKSVFKVIVIANEDEIVNVQSSYKIEDRFNFALNLIRHENDLQKSTNTNDNKKNVLTDTKKDDKITKEDISSRVYEFFSDFEQYNKMKEKVFGYTVTIKNDIHTIYKDLIKDFDASTEKSFIEHKSFILSVHEYTYSKNLRLLKRSLDVLDNLLKNTREFFEGISDKELKENIIKSILAFTISCYHLVKQNNINYSKEFSELDTSELGWYYGGNKNSFLGYIYKHFVNNLKDSVKFIYFKSIGNFILNGTLDLHMLFNDLNTCKIIHENYINKSRGTCSYDVAEELLYFYTMEEANLKNKLTELLSNIDKGYYETKCYTKLLQLLLLFRLHNLIEISDLTLEETFIKGINNSDLSGKMIFPHQTFSYYDENESKLVKLVTDSVNNKCKDAIMTNQKNLLDDILDGLLTDFDSSIQLLYNEYGEDVQKLFFRNLSIDKIIEFIKNSTNEELYSLRSFIDRKYNFGNLADFYKDEDSNLVKLIGCLETLEITDKVKSFNIKMLITKCKEIHESISK